ncbi:hypothetical protein OIU79_018071 [Salix purpurea]|uniref:Uncharacterized protein n=1 Tax=Salix purpurea TaxID=77065 RepID=A0A9Q0WWK2_SALPP|nr:hypothetical protein OIU79_018071 [Salix purpurea]
MTTKTPPYWPDSPPCPWLLLCSKKKRTAAFSCAPPQPAQLLIGFAENEFVAAKMIWLRHNHKLGSRTLAFASYTMELTASLRWCSGNS